MATQRGVLHRTIALCKRHGFLFQSPRSTNKGSVNYIYGPLGAELKRNLLNEWLVFVKIEQSCIQSVGVVKFSSTLVGGMQL